jgi:hypothetical protein
MRGYVPELRADLPPDVMAWEYIKIEAPRRLREDSVFALEVGTRAFCNSVDVP